MLLVVGRPATCSHMKQLGHFHDTTSNITNQAKLRTGKHQMLGFGIQMTYMLSGHTTYPTIVGTW